MGTAKPCVKLEDWAVVPTQHIVSYRELRPGNLLVGKVFGHPKIQEGMFILTSRIISCDKNNKFAETKNTAYRLGEASHEYKAWTLQQETGTAA
jgi:hypothetical protein